jgi:endonuclease III
MRSLKDQRSRVGRIVRLLSRQHGPRAWRRHGRGLDVLVEAMLAQNTNLANSVAGYRQLRRALPTWTKVMTAPVADVQRQIAVCGLARMRARRLQALLARIKRERGALNLEFLATEPPDVALAYLLRFHGIGPKTAAYTLLLSFGMPVFPVDNGILRLAKRLRLVSQKARDAETGRAIEKLTRPGDVYALHVLSFRHAKTICRPRNPKCGECLLLGECPYGQRRVKHRPAESREQIIVRARRVSLSKFASDGLAKRATEDPHPPRGR